MTDLRYPIGVFTPVDPSAAVRERAIDEIEALPERLAGAIKELNDAQLDTPYRPGGWTVRQVVHHVADSHINALIRMKLALTEEQPTVVGYDEKKFAELPDTRLSVDVSLQLLRSLHARWVALYRAKSATRQPIDRYIARSLSDRSPPRRALDTAVGTRRVHRVRERSHKRPETHSHRTVASAHSSARNSGRAPLRRALDPAC